MADARLNILLAAKNRASGPIKQVQGDLSGLDKAAGTAAKGLGALTAVAGAAGIAALSGMAFEMARTGAEAQRLEGSFQQLATSADQDADQMLQAMREASRGMVADTDLILSANRAMLLGVADTSEEMAQLLEVAGARGKAMDVSLSSAFSDIVTGIGRMSPLILDNLGIVVDQAAANEAYATSLGKTADMLSDAEKKQALLNAVIRDSQGLIADNAAAGDDLASKFERMDASIQNAKTALGELFAPAVAVIAENIARAAEAASDGIGKVGDALDGVDQGDPVARFRALQEQVKVGSQEWVIYQKAINALTGSLDSAVSGHNDVAAALQLAGNSAGTATLDMVTFADSLNSTEKAVDPLINKLLELDRTATSVGANVQRSIFGIAVDQAGGDIVRAFSLSMEQSNQIISEANRLMFEGNLTLEQRDQFIIPQLIQRERELHGELTRTSRKVSEIDQEYQELLGTVQSVLSGALDLGDIGIDDILKDALPREDAINEDARRLADVAVRGFESPWADYFKTSFPALWAEAFSGTEAGGDIKAQAAQILREFQQGLRPELIDREAVKERVRAMIFGEQNLSEIAQEIATELSEEMGGSVSAAGLRSVVNQALGLRGDEIGSGLAAGQEFGSGAVEGVGNAGGQMIATLTAQLKLESNLALVREAGNTNGTAFANSFIEFFGGSVPAAVIGILADLVTPAVESRINVQGTLTSPQGAQ